jgi:hypothetical protein
MTSAQSKAPFPPVRRFFIVGKLIKSGPDQHSPSFSSSARTAEVRWAGLPAFLCRQAIPRTRQYRGVRKAVVTTCLSVNSTQIWPTGYNDHWHPVRVGAYQIRWPHVVANRQDDRPRLGRCPTRLGDAQAGVRSVSVSLATMILSSGLPAPAHEMVRCQR